MPPESLWAHPQEQGYINDKGRCRTAWKASASPDERSCCLEAFEPQRQQVVALLKKVSGKLEVKNADDRKHIPVRKSVLISPEFKALWDRIKHKTTYRCSSTTTS